MTGFEQASTETLETVRANLLDGLTAVAATLADGSFAIPGGEGCRSPVAVGADHADAAARR